MSETNCLTKQFCMIRAVVRLTGCGSPVKVSPIPSIVADRSDSASASRNAHS